MSLSQSSQQSSGKTGSITNGIACFTWRLKLQDLMQSHVRVKSLPSASGKLLFTKASNSLHVYPSFLIKDEGLQITMTKFLAKY